MLVIPLFGHHFPMIGSLYDGSSPSNHTTADFSSSLPTPTPATYERQTDIHDALTRLADASRETHVGPIISWPFFGSGRGDLAHPAELNRGPWRSAHAYLHACADREVRGVVAENEGKAAPHKLHLDPDEIETSRHHKVGALPDDRSDTSDEWDWEESEAEWDGPGATMYQDYRRMQRTTFLVAHLAQREERVKAEMARFLRMMERLGVVAHGEGDGGGGESDRGGAEELFSIDCHDLNLENVFVDENDNSKIVSIYILYPYMRLLIATICTHRPASSIGSRRRRARSGRVRTSRPSCRTRRSLRSYSLRPSRSSRATRRRPRSSSAAPPSTSPG